MRLSSRHHDRLALFQLMRCPRDRDFGLSLEKMDQGTYGTCDACGGKIVAQRLEALPFATLCLSCQSRLEGR